ncbi:MAG: FAD binding domain-containing protein [Planctomycetes bacterium]|nr:FAD binding domain-containing protein [Planctomycetota bacterium]
MYLALERYTRPSSVAEALAAYAGGKGGVLLGGGSTLNVEGNHEEVEHVIDLQGLPWKQLASGAQGVEVGALVSLRALGRAAAAWGPRFAAIAPAALAYPVVGLLNRATVGGRVMLDRNDVDLHPVLAALDARLLVVDDAGERALPFPTDAAGRRALAGCLLRGLQLPAGGGRSSFHRHARIQVDRPLCNAAAWVEGSEARVFAGVQGPDAALTRLGAVEGKLSGWGDQRPPDWRGQVREAALADLVAYEDPWASGTYRQDVTATLVVRCLAEVFGEAVSE